jgi:hypothetical protein
MKSKTTLWSKSFLVLTILFTVVSCQTSFDFSGEKGNGNIVTQTRTITESFEKIKVNSGLEVIVSQEDVRLVEVETDENIQPMITTVVENGVLIISSNGNYETDETPIVRVSLPIISSLKSSSGATIISGNTLKSNSLEVKSSSGSQAELDVEADYISIESSSGSSIEVKGKALKAETSSSSGSSIDGGSLMANDIFAQTSSGSSTTVFPILSLNAKASSGSEITYTNIPKKLEKTESSGGSINKN